MGYLQDIQTLMKRYSHLEPKKWIPPGDVAAAHVDDGDRPVLTGGGRVAREAG